MRHSPSVCTLDNKIFVMGGGHDSCEMLDLSDDDAQWKYMADMNRTRHNDNSAVVIEKKVYVLGGIDTSVEVYDADQGILMDIFKFRPSSNKRSSISIL